MKKEEDECIFCREIVRADDREAIRITTRRSTKLVIHKDCFFKEQKKRKKESR